MCIKGNIGCCVRDFLRLVALPLADLRRALGDDFTALSLHRAHSHVSLNCSARHKSREDSGAAGGIQGSARSKRAISKASATHQQKAATGALPAVFPWKTASKFALLIVASFESCTALATTI